ncbi:MAG: hypothetical protein JZU47_06465 [Prolixibacteraceae bacterium]|nr:hypothetical protein [Prolixibacteraceae bacterium]
MFIEINVHFSGLKDRYIIAQGRVSGGTIRNAALGMYCGGKTVRENSIIKANIPFRTDLGFMPFRPTQGNYFNKRYRTDDFKTRF